MCYEIDKEDIDYLSTKCLFEKGIENYTEMPQLGDIVMGKVVSEQAYGFFVDIVSVSGHGRNYTISGLLHNSQLDTKSPYSIGNKTLQEKGLDPTERSVLVEIIKVNEKGYSLKEVSGQYDVSINDIKDFDLKENSYSTTKDIKVLIDDSEIMQKEILETIKINFHHDEYGNYSRFCLFKNEIYYEMLSRYDKIIYMTKEYKFIVKNYYRVYIFDSKEKIPTKNNYEAYLERACWYGRESIEKENKEVLDKYYRKKKDLEREKDRKIKERLLLEDLLKIGAKKTMKMYLYEICYISDGKAVRDRSTSNSDFYEDSADNVVTMEIFDDNGRDFFRANGNWINTYYHSNPSLYGSSYGRFYEDNLRIDMSTGKRRSIYYIYKISEYN